MGKFILGLLLCVLIWVAPVVFLLIGFLTWNKVWFIVSFICILILLITKDFCYNLLHNGRQEKDYDEFGRSKRKQIKNLSRAEQDAIDLQNVADMERLLSTPVIKKITKKGSENPKKDLETMIGLNEVKQKVMEMSARMEFEKQCNKGKSKKDRINSMSGRHFVFYGSAGTGKAQPLYSKVLTPKGFVRMGDIKVGDTVISGTNKPAKVLGVYPQGKKDIYEITFDDGSKCQCSDEHLWNVQTDDDRKQGVYRTIELKEIINNFSDEQDVKKYNYSVDYVKAVDFEEKDFYIHPYLLGVLLGNGYLERGETTISLFDKQLKKYIYNFFPDKHYKLFLKEEKHNNNPNMQDYTIAYYGKKIGKLSPLDYHLYLLDLKGCNNNEKFIPKEYLYASKEQRKWLLKGLLDTDGFANGDIIEYSTTSEKIKNDIIELVHSLGGFASFEKKYGAYKHYKAKTIIKEYYKICIKFPSDDKDYFNLKRKKYHYKPTAKNKTMKRFITNIKYIGKEECKCIYIDDVSHLYITDDYIITHNTTVARIITGFLYDYGYIKKNKVVEVDGNFLKAGADTSKKVKYITQIAYDGVLFIDEAYVLCEGAYGDEAVATLIKEMEDNRDRFVCILAGYTKDMNILLDSNTGFKSRIKEYLNFPDYSIQDMKEIFTMMAHEQNFVVSKEALDNLEIRLAKEKKLKTFGNGRTVRNVLDESIDKHSLNYIQKNIPENAKFCICKEDVSTEIKIHGIT